MNPRPAGPRERPDPVPARAPGPAPAASGVARLLPWVALALVLLFVVVVRVRWLDVPLERDEGEYAYAGQLILRGIPPYQLVYNMKLPGAYMAYALFLALFGPTARAVRLGLLLVNAASIVLLFLLGRRLGGSLVAAVAAAAYALLSVGTAVQGPFAHSSHLVVLAALGGVLWLLRAFDTGRARDHLGSGLLLGLALVMKQHGAFFLLFGAFALLTRRRGPGVRGSRWTADVAPFAAGAALPLILTGLALAVAGVFSSFWFWTFRYAAAYVTEVSLSAGPAALRDGFAAVVVGAPLLWAAGAIGLLLVILDPGTGPWRGMLGAFAVFAFLAICPGLYFREHYFVMLLPAVALLVGVAVDGLRRALAGTGLRRRATAVSAALFLMAFLVSLVPQVPLLLRTPPARLVREVYGANPFPEAREVARYIAAHSSPDDRIVVLGSEPEIYFYAGRRSATGHIYMYGLMERQPYARAMQRQLIREVETGAPQWLVFVNVWMSWLPRPDSERELLDWSARYVASHYVAVGRVDIHSPTETSYTWRDSVSAPDARTRFFLMVYRRKPHA